jgi:fructose-bisphosphate aldolase class 1
MVAPGKGLLAMDESNRTCNKRFEDVGIAPTRFDRRTATTIASNCFQGVYGWTLWSTHRRVVIDADVSSYVQPEITRPESGVNIFEEIAEPEEKRAG